MRWVLCGASSGLGEEFAKIIDEKGDEFLTISRRPNHYKNGKVFIADFSKAEQWPTVIENILNFEPERFVYFSGGGPYGHFVEKKFSDHQWAWKVCFEFPAFLIHQLIEKQPLKQMTFIGSAIAEAKPDPRAASYCASKHALKGLIESIKLETNFDLRLYSPGYMDTKMLPVNAWPRTQVGLVSEPSAVAQELFNWLASR